MRYLPAFASLLIYSLNLQAQNPLFIPDTLGGSLLKLNVQAGTKEFFKGYNTPTYGYNGKLLGPTLLMSKGANISIEVKNSLDESTTVHWHGFHVAPQNDGGPHQVIEPGNTWKISFKVMNKAATYWYHPHGEMQTERQVSKGLAGMIIVRDSAEESYILPRQYGVDDFPIIVQSKAFDELYQLATANHEDSFVMVNGTLDPYLQAPQQVVRLRLLNGSSDRTYNFGLSDNSNFYMIAGDGGFLSKPLSLKRLRLSPGERADILVDFGSYKTGDRLYLKSYASALPRGIIGADSVGRGDTLITEGYYGNRLNGADFNILRLDIIPATASAVKNIPGAFASVNPYPESSAEVHRKLVFSPDTMVSGKQGFVDGPFLINGKVFHMDSVNIRTTLGSTEIWTLVNNTMVAHPFHIHDEQFYILDVNGNKPSPELQGPKDMVLVMPHDSVRFIVRFTDFANDTIPYMYHCHLLHHEDDGMMGSFLVMDTASSGITKEEVKAEVKLYPNPAENELRIQLPEESGRKVNMNVYDMLGREIISSHAVEKATAIRLDVSGLKKGSYILKIDSGGKQYFARFVK